MAKNITLSIVIVNYKADEELRVLLKTLPRRPDWECIIIENSEENIGYGAGCNKGAEQAKGEYLLLLNPDVVLEEKDVLSMLGYLKAHKNVGVVGPQFVEKNGMIEQTSAGQPTPFMAGIALSWLSKIFPGLQQVKEYRLTDWDRTTTKEVGAVSGAAIMVRKEDFQKLGGFDPKFFLYWEEVDLCRRMKHVLGKTTVFLAEAKAQHQGQVSSKKTGRDLSQVFTQSRRWFFRKHFGILQTSLLEGWLVLCQEWRLVVILALAAFLRFFTIFDRVTVIGDMGRDYLAARDMIVSGSIPLLGIPSSVPRFAQGPLNIWFTTLSFIFGGINLYSPVIFSGGLQVFTAGAVYLFVQSRWGKVPAFIAGLFFAISPATVLQSRMPFYLFAVPLFTLVYLWALTSLRVRTAKSVFLAVFAYGLLFQWELATLPLAALLPLALWKEKIQIKSAWKALAIGAAAGFLPQIAYDLTHRCSQLCGFVAWTGYRLLATTGFDNRHGISVESILRVIQTIWQQWILIIGKNELISAVALVVALFAALIIVRKKIVQDRAAFYVCSGIGILLLGFLIHGAPSEAYFPPFIMLFSLGLGYAAYVFPARLRALLLVGILLLAVKNSVILVKHQFYSDSIRQTIRAARWIVEDAQGNPIAVQSYDPDAQFPTYLDHFRFVILQYGGKLDFQGKRYSIALDQETILPTINTKQVEFGNIRIAVEL